MSNTRNIYNVADASPNPLLWHVVEGLIPGSALVEACKKQLFFHGTYDDATAFAYVMGRRYTISNRPLRILDNRLVVQPTRFRVRPVLTTDSDLCQDYTLATGLDDEARIRDGKPFWWSIGPDPNGYLGFLGTEAQASRAYYRALAAYLYDNPELYDGGFTFDIAILEQSDRYARGERLLDLDGPNAHRIPGVTHAAT